MAFVELSGTVLNWIRRADTKTLTCKIAEYAGELADNNLSPRDVETKHALCNAMRKELAQRKEAEA